MTTRPPRGPGDLAHLGVPQPASAGSPHGSRTDGCQAASEVMSAGPPDGVPSRVEVGVDGPTFAQPWEASVLAMTVQLGDRGILSWPRFADALGARLVEDPEYYRAWAAALVDVLTQDGLLTPAEVEAMTARWHDAAARTPHGHPISL